MRNHVIPAPVYILASVLSACYCVRDCSSPRISMDSYKSQLEKFKAKQVIKDRILGGLGYNTRPFPATQLRKSSACKIINIVQDNGTSTTPPKGDYYAEIQEVISFSEPADQFRDENIIQFKLVRDSQRRKLEVKSANVLVKLKYKRSRKRGQASGSNVNKKRRRSKSKITLVLSTVGENGLPDEEVTSLRADVRKTNWFKLGIPNELVENAMISGDQIIKLHIQCLGCRRRAQLVLVHGSRRRRKSRKHKRKGTMRVMNPRKRPKRRLSRTRPFLILHTKVETFIRRRRDLSVCTGEDVCCKSELVFSFYEVGWNDWILHPAAFTTGVCSGSCPEVTRDVQGTAANATPSCGAVRHSPLRVIYYDQSGNIVTSSIPNLIVEGCGCV